MNGSRRLKGMDCNPEKALLDEKDLDDLLALFSLKEIDDIINYMATSDFVYKNTLIAENVISPEKETLYMQTLSGKEVISNPALLEQIVTVYVELFSEPSKQGEVEWGEELSPEVARNKLFTQLSRDNAKCTLAKTREGAVVGFATYWSSNPRIEGLIHVANSINSYLEENESPKHEQRLQDQLAVKFNQLGVKDVSLTIIEEIGIIKNKRGLQSIVSLANEVMLNIQDNYFVMWTKSGGKMDNLSKILGFLPLGQRSAKKPVKVLKDGETKIETTQITLVAYVENTNRIRLMTRNLFTQMTYLIWSSLKADLSNGSIDFAGTRKSIRRLFSKKSNQKK